MTSSRRPSEFTRNVIEILRAIPRGRVGTYGQIAALAGRPGAAHGVVWILASSSRIEKLPWHRVVGAKGKISFAKDSPNFTRQTRLLRREGVEIDDGILNLGRFGWREKARVKYDPRHPRLFS